MEKYYQQKDAEIMREIGDLSRRESELKFQKNEEESELAAHQKVLEDNRNRLSAEEDRLEDAERKLKNAKEDESKNIKIGAVIGGVLLGLVGAAAGAGIGAIVNACKQEEKDAQNAVDRLRSDLGSARFAVKESLKRISNVKSQIKILGEQIEHLKPQCLQSQKKLDEIRPLIVIVKESVYFWLLYI